MVDGHYILTLCQGYINNPPTNSFALGRMSLLLELANNIGYHKADTVVKAQQLFVKLAPKIAKQKRK